MRGSKQGASPSIDHCYPLLFIIQSRWWPELRGEWIYSSGVSQRIEHIHPTHGPVVLRMPAQNSRADDFYWFWSIAFLLNLWVAFSVKKLHRCVIVNIGHGHGHCEDSKLMCVQKFWYSFTVPELWQIQNMGRKMTFIKTYFAKAMICPCYFPSLSFHTHTTPSQCPHPAELNK